MNVFKGILAVLGGIVLIALLAWGGRELGWWLKADNTYRQGKIDQTTFSRQNGLVSQINSHADDVRTIDVQITTATGDQLTALNAQRRAIVQSICVAEANLNGTVEPTASAQSIISKEC